MGLDWIGKECPARLSNKPVSVGLDGQMDLVLTLSHLFRPARLTPSFEPQHFARILTAQIVEPWQAALRSFTGGYRSESFPNCSSQRSGLAERIVRPRMV